MQANYAFMSVFILEVVLKVYAFTWGMYIKQAWNKFDFVMVLLGVIDIALAFLQVNYLRIIRIFRIQKLIAVVSGTIVLGWLSWLDAG